MNQPLQAAGLKNADAGGTNAAEALAAAEAALAAAEWSRAVELFQLSIEREESAEALEGLGWAGWWLADEELTFGARMRAFQLHRAAGERAAAARVAAWIAADFREYRGEEATARGWMQRAASLLDGLPEVPEHELELELPLGAVRGLVRGADGEPLANARVTLATEGGLQSGAVQGAGEAVGGNGQEIEACRRAQHHQDVERQDKLDHFENRHQAFDHSTAHPLQNGRDLFFLCDFHILFTLK